MARKRHSPQSIAAVLRKAECAMSVFTTSSPETKASVWVAIGTIALAFVTAASILQTRILVAAEDRRHQQTFVPLLELHAKANQQMRSITSFDLVNIGPGVALNISVRLKGYSEIPEYANRSATGEAIQTGIKVVDINCERFCSAVGPKDSVTITDDLFAHGNVSSEMARFKLAEVRYNDMFGNRFVTTYQDERLTKYHWGEPNLYLRSVKVESPLT